MAARGNATANRSGNGELVADVSGASIKILRLIVGNSAAGTVTFKSGGSDGTTLFELEFGAAGSMEIGDGMVEIDRTVAGENLYVSADSGTLQAHVAYTQE